MSTHDSHQLSSYNSDSLSWANEDELNESNDSPDQLPSSGVTVTNSLVTDKDGLEKECGNDYELSTGTGNLKAHL
ncbi:14749_t:CDS:2, partial [Dentiscutata heterogama]